jgi:hypothetical protein
MLRGKLARCAPMGRRLRQTSNHSTCQVLSDINGRLQSISLEPSVNSIAGSAEVEVPLTFLDLPAEIRVKTWGFAARFPR